ncbi:MAG: YceI family protein [Emcibacter sp.]|nr:YceI family protein [Emcibacter sp.]
MTVKKSSTIFALLLLTMGLIINPARADWILDQENSSLSFGSIKKNSIGESNSFYRLDGRITAGGDITLLIDLTSVETWVDIRNARMKEFFFETYKFPMAELNGQIDMAQFESLEIGGQKSVEISFDLDFHGLQQTFDAQLVVLRLSDKSVVVIPDEIIFLDVEKFNLLPGLERLKKLANLPSISSSVPISFRLSFNQTP